MRASRFSEEQISLAVLPICYPQLIRSQKLMRHNGGNTLKSQDHREGFRTLLRNPMKCEFFICHYNLTRDFIKI
jgi:hypothetical protein